MTSYNQITRDGMGSIGVTAQQDGLIAAFISHPSIEHYKRLYRCGMNHSIGKFYMTMMDFSEGESEPVKTEQKVLECKDRNEAYRLLIARIISDYESATAQINRANKTCIIDVKEARRGLEKLLR